MSLAEELEQKYQFDKHLQLVPPPRPKPLSSMLRDEPLCLPSGTGVRFDVVTEPNSRFRDAVNEAIERCAMAAENCPLITGDDEVHERTKLVTALSIRRLKSVLNFQPHSESKDSLG